MSKNKIKPKDSDTLNKLDRKLINKKIRQLVKNQKTGDPEIMETVHRRFWDLI